VQREITHMDRPAVCRARLAPCIMRVMDGLTDTPGSVLPCRYRRGNSGHPSTDAVADALQRPTRALGRAALKRALSGLAPGGVYLASPVTREAGGLLHHRFTLTWSPPCETQDHARRSVLCGTGLRVTPSGRYPPPCSAEPGRSSSHLRDARPPGQPIRHPFYGAAEAGDHRSLPLISNTDIRETPGHARAEALAPIIRGWTSPL
jgi:hypothetical protein